MSPNPLCQGCQRYSANPHLDCAIHPDGPPSDACPDYAPTADALAVAEDDLWQPLVTSYYEGQPMPEFVRAVPIDEQWGLQDWHPLYTGVCPSCGVAFDPSNPPEVHWDCAQCGWKDDTV